jgi:hypothetical protein
MRSINYALALLTISTLCACQGGVAGAGRAFDSPDGSVASGIRDASHRQLHAPRVVYPANSEKLDAFRASGRLTQMLRDFEEHAGHSSVSSATSTYDAYLRTLPKLLMSRRADIAGGRVVYVFRDAISAPLAVGRLDYVSGTHIEVRDAQTGDLVSIVLRGRTKNSPQRAIKSSTKARPGFVEVPWATSGFMSIYNATTKFDGGGMTCPLPHITRPSGGATGAFIGFERDVNATVEDQYESYILVGFDHGNMFAATNYNGGVAINNLEYETLEWGTTINPFTFPNDGDSHAIWTETEVEDPSLTDVALDLTYAVVGLPQYEESNGQWVGDVMSIGYANGPETASGGIPTVFDDFDSPMHCTNVFEIAPNGETNAPWPAADVETWNYFPVDQTTGSVTYNGTTGTATLTY